MLVSGDGARAGAARLSAALVVLTGLALGGCALLPTTGSDTRHRAVAPFSAALPGDDLPAGWGPWQISRFKRDTQYRLVRDADGTTVLEALAERSASGLIKKLDVDLSKTPWLAWRWNVPALIPGADNRDRVVEDSPVRVVVTFDGDRSRFDVEDAAIAARIKALTGQEMPYATLMYIWENQAPAGAIIDNAHTGRVKMLVVESGTAQSGRWLHVARHVADDFHRAYGEAPGRILSVGLMTDTDNTGETTRAYYGDIQFLHAAPGKLVH